MALLARRNREINKVVMLPVAQIQPNPHQPRKHFDPVGVQELCGSILANGLLQPITVRRIRDQTYELIAGERRLIAFRTLGRGEIPAIIEEYSNDQSAVFALIENLQRKDLNYFEEALAYSKLMEELKLTQLQLSQRLGKAQSTIANKLRLLRYPQSLQERMLKAGLTERHARTLLRIYDKTTLDNAVTHIIKNHMTVDQTEHYVERLLGQEKTVKKPRIFVVKDMRIFLNSIDRAVEMMQSAGIAVDSNRREDEEYFEVVLRVPKTQIYHRLQTKAQ